MYHFKQFIYLGRNAASYAVCFHNDEYEIVSQVLFVLLLERIFIKLIIIKPIYWQ